MSLDVFNTPRDITIVTITTSHVYKYLPELVLLLLLDESLEESDRLEESESDWLEESSEESEESTSCF